MLKLVNESPLFAMDQEFMNLFYKKKPTDCILYSEDGIQFKVHKEIFSQTEFMQNILTSAKEFCCQTLEIICPCSKVELAYVVKFLYEGQLKCDLSFDFANILKILSKVFGFPKKFLDDWQEEFEITQEVFDQQNNENTKIFDADFDKKNEDDSIEEELSNPIVIPLKPKKFKSVNVKQRSRSVHDKNSTNKKFRTSDNLKIHEVTHTRERPFSCNICFRRFYEKSKLKRHQLIHEGEKAYPCNYCDLKFRQHYNMKRHIATVHKGKERRK